MSSIEREAACARTLSRSRSRIGGNAEVRIDSGRIRQEALRLGVVWGGFEAASAELAPEEAESEWRGRAAAAYEGRSIVRRDLVPGKRPGHEIKRSSRYTAQQVRF